MPVLVLLLIQKCPMLLSLQRDHWVIRESVYSALIYPCLLVLQLNRFCFSSSKSIVNEVINMPKPWLCFVPLPPFCWPSSQALEQLYSFLESYNVNQMPWGFLVPPWPGISHSCLVESTARMFLPCFCWGCSCCHQLNSHRFWRLLLGILVSWYKGIDAFVHFSWLLEIIAVFEQLW